MWNLRARRGPYPASVGFQTSSLQATSQHPARPKQLHFDVSLRPAHHPGDIVHAHVLGIMKPKSLELRSTELAARDCPELFGFIAVFELRGRGVKSCRFRQEAFQDRLDAPTVVDAFASCYGKEPRRERHRRFVSGKPMIGRDEHVLHKFTRVSVIAAPVQGEVVKRLFEPANEFLEHCQITVFGEFGDVLV